MDSGGLPNLSDITRANRRIRADIKPTPLLNIPDLDTELGYPIRGLADKREK